MLLLLPDILSTDVVERTMEVAMECCIESDVVSGNDGWVVTSDVVDVGIDGSVLGVVQRR